MAKRTWEELVTLGQKRTVIFRVVTAKLPETKQKRVEEVMVSLRIGQNPSRTQSGRARQTKSDRI